MNEMKEQQIHREMARARRNGQATRPHVVALHSTKETPMSQLNDTATRRYTTVQPHEAVDAPVNRIADRADGGPQPHVRTREGPELAEPFGRILDDLIAESLMDPPGSAATGKQWIEWYVQRRAFQRRAGDDWNGLLRHSIETGIEVRPDGTDVGRALELAKEKFEELRPSIPEIGVVEDEVLDWELAALPVAEMGDRLTDSLKRSAEKLVRRMPESLDALKQRHLCGWIESHPKKKGVYRYFFRRSAIVLEKVSNNTYATGRRKGRTTRSTDNVRRESKETTEILETRVTERGKKAIHRNAEHEHQIYDAQFYPCSDQTLPKPEWIKQLIAVMPAWVRDRYAWIVAGDMLRERIVEVDTHVEDWTEKSVEEIKVAEEIRTGLLESPAVGIGHWVLAGWSDREIAS